MEDLVEILLRVVEFALGVSGDQKIHAAVAGQFVEIGFHNGVISMIFGFADEIQLGGTDPFRLHRFFYDFGFFRRLRLWKRFFVVSAALCFITVVVIHDAALDIVDFFRVGKGVVFLRKALVNRDRFVACHSLDVIEPYIDFVGGRQRKKFLHEVAVAEYRGFQPLDVLFVKGNRAVEMLPVFEVQTQGDEWIAVSVVIGVVVISSRIFRIPDRRRVVCLLQIVSVFVGQLLHDSRDIADGLGVVECRFVGDGSAEGFLHTEERQLVGENFVAHQCEGFYFIGGGNGVEFRLHAEEADQQRRHCHGNGNRGIFKGAVGVFNVEGQQQFDRPEAARDQQNRKDKGK